MERPVERANFENTPIYDLKVFYTHMKWYFEEETHIFKYY